MKTHKLWDVTFFARKHGAIGVFYPITRRVLGENKEDAKENCFFFLHRDGYETNHCMNIDLVDESSERERRRYERNMQNMMGNETDD